MRNSTGPVVLYILLTMRDQPPDKLAPVLSLAVELFKNIKKQSLPAEELFISDFAEVLHILSDNNHGKIPSELLTVRHLTFKITFQ